MVHQTINSGFCFLFNKIADSVRRTSDYQVDGKTVAFSHVSASPSWVAAGAIGDTAATTQQREGGRREGGRKGPSAGGGGGAS